MATRGEPVDVLWASPDCRHFSRAKGGKPCHPKVRSLAWQVVEWAKQTRPQVIGMENVPEFLTWGPLGEDHRPIEARKGETFSAWVNELRELGYHVDWRVLTACNYGAPTSRKRLFVVARLGDDVTWPEPTHGPGLTPYRTAAECIDWSDLGASIFNRKRPLADATHRRIAHGLVRFVLEAKRPFLINTRNGERPGQTPRCLSVDEPMRTITAAGSQGALVVPWIAKHYGGVVGHGVARPLGTITATDSHGLAVAYLTKFYGTSIGSQPDAPLGTITAGAGGGHHGLVAAFLTKFYGRSIGQPADAPVGTLTTKDRFGLVTVEVNGETYAVVDVSMRMLQPHELQLAQGFPASYRLEGTKKLRTRLIGNSVPPQLSEAVIRANAPRLRRAVA